MQSPYRVNVSTTDPDEAHHWLSEHYMPLTARLAGSPKRFRFQHSYADVGRFGVNVLEDSMSTVFDAMPSKDRLLVVQPVSGQHQASNAGNAVDTGPGESLIFDPDTQTRTACSANVRLTLLTVNRAHVERVAAEYGDPGATVRFSLSGPVSKSKARAWQNLLRYLTDDFLPNPAARGSTLVRTEMQRMLAAALLETFPNSTMTHSAVRAGMAGPASVRRAVTFIEEFAGEDIDLSQVASAARVSPRALQLAFRRHLGTSPLTYLRGIRLERAHRELQAADPARARVTVTDIANRWGFTNPSRFASAYRQKYGHPPGHTLYS